MSRWAPAYLERVNRGFAAVYALLERPRVARNAVVALLAMLSGLLAYSAYVHSPTLNEPGHLVAGLSYWKFGRFDVYNVNPPLVKMVAALPVMAAGYEEDWSGFYSGPGARPETAMGEDFVVANGKRSFFLFMIARWGCIPFSWLGGIICYLWARDLYGRPAGVIACAIWCFEPNILAHASLMTPDAHATALGLAACYTFWRWLKHPTWMQAIVTGGVLGLAELAKTTLILLYPLWPLLWLIYRWQDRKIMRLSDWLREAGMLTVRMAIGTYVVSLGYGFEDSLKPLGEYRFVSDLFNGRKPADSATPSNFVGNRFTETRLGAIPIPFPRNYLMGIDIQQRDFEAYSRPSYLRGEWRGRGWWYYYLYAVAIKVPLGLWALGAVSLVVFFSRPAADNLHPSASRRDLFILLAPPLVIFVAVSSKTGFSEHMRYVLPCFPFAFVWVANILKNFLDSDVFDSVPCQSSFANVRQRIRQLTAVPCLAMLLWFIASSLWIYPHSLCYFNEGIGGPIQGPNHLLGSSLDWGQDLKYVAAFVSERPVYEPIVLACLAYPKSPINEHNELPLASHLFDYPLSARTCVISASLLMGSSTRAWVGVGRRLEKLETSQVHQLRRSHSSGTIGYTHRIFTVTN